MICFIADGDVEDNAHIEIDIQMKHESSGLTGWHLGIMVRMCTEPGVCCPCDTGGISYSTQSMQVDEEQVLSVSDPGTMSGSCFAWAKSGGGTLSESAGLTTTYTAPSTNAECANNPTIVLSCNGVEQDSLTIGINENAGVAEAYITFPGCGPANRHCGGAGICVDVVEETRHCMQASSYQCDGTLISNVREVFFGMFYGTNYYVQACAGGTLLDCGTTPDTCDCMEAYMEAEWGTGLGSTKDMRTAQMITDGCCPGEVL